jgi:hypothetical protein
MMYNLSFILIKMKEKLYIKCKCFSDHTASQKTCLPAHTCLDVTECIIINPQSIMAFSSAYSFYTAPSTSFARCLPHLTPAAATAYSSSTCCSSLLSAGLPYCWYLYPPTSLAPFPTFLLLLLLLIAFSSAYYLLLLPPPHLPH